MKSTPEQLVREKVRGIARAAIRDGTLVPTPCVRCSDPDKKVVAHHDDYSRPLDVTFLCEKCHKDRHRELGWGFAPGEVKRSRGTNVSLDARLVEIARVHFPATRHGSLSGFVDNALRREFGLAER